MERFLACFCLTVRLSAFLCFSIRLCVSAFTGLSLSKCLLARLSLLRFCPPPPLPLISPEDDVGKWKPRCGCLTINTGFFTLPGFLLFLWESGKIDSFVTPAKLRFFFYSPFPPAPAISCGERQISGIRRSLGKLWWISWQSPALLQRETCQRV